jgi:hypothetical protein
MTSKLASLMSTAIPFCQNFEAKKEGTKTAQKLLGNSSFKLGGGGRAQWSIAPLKSKTM